MRLGLFGGSFDPIHRGHIEPVLEAKDQLSLDRVIYLPTARPPHKTDRRFAPAYARYAMVEIALLPYRDLIVSAHELTVDRQAYTIETLEHFRLQEPQAELYLLVGADSYNELDQWRRWREILDLATLVVLDRPGAMSLRPDLAVELREQRLPARVVRIENKLCDLSSTELRRAMGDGREPNEGAMPRLVLDYCWKYSLYR